MTTGSPAGAASFPRKTYVVELVTQEEVEQTLQGYDSLAFPAWVLALNSWRWPEDCPIPCPLLEEFFLVAVGALLELPLPARVSSALCDAPETRALLPCRRGRSQKGARRWAWLRAQSF